MAVAQTVGQLLQPVARQHELLQVWTLAQFARQFTDVIVGQDQPAQQRRQCISRYVFDAVGLETDHGQRRALAQACWQFGEQVVRAEQHAQTGQAMQVVRQAAQGIATEVEHFQRIRQVENFPGEFAQVIAEVQASDACQRSGAQLCKGVHIGGRCRSNEWAA
ncbi:hypothetical protein D3C84_658640 [compost metagenome]